MSKKQRQSKYRHIYGEPAKPEKQFQEIKAPLTSGEGQYVKANSKYFAVARSSGGGPVYLRRLDEPGRFSANMPMLSVHKGKTVDFDFHPFIDTMIATASEDCKAAISQFPAEGLTESITQPVVTLEGHSKKVALVEFNPCASSILATGAFDRTVKVWNIEKSTCIADFTALADNIYSIGWNQNGSLLACTSKDKTCRIFDPRDTDGSTQSFEAFDGGKSSKLFWVPKFNWICATGFSKASKRQLKFWDMKNLSEPCFKLDIDQGNSVLMPHWDNDNGVLYLAGKGDGSINYHELVDDSRKLYSLGSYRNTEPQKGGGWVPKKGLDVWKCEVARFLKLTKKSIIPISFIVPRKVGSDIFQEDIFPDCYAGKAVVTADEWESGENKDPLLMSMDPAKRGDDDSVSTFTKKKTYVELEQENKELKARITELEQQLGDTSTDDQKTDA